MAKGKKLTHKQELFCEYYIECLNASEAAKKAGYKESSAPVIGHRWLRDDRIKDRIRLSQKRHQTKLDITVEMILKELWNIANLDPAEAFNEDGSIKNIHDMPPNVRKAIASFETYQDYTEGVEVGEVKKIKFWPKNNALHQIGKHLGMFIERIESKTLSVNVDQTSPEFEKMKEALLESTSPIRDVKPVRVDADNDPEG